MEQPIVVDPHAHFFSLQKYQPDALASFDWPVIFSSHGKEEITALQNHAAPNVFRSVGIHPQDPDKNLLSDLENAVKSGKFCAIGEIGLDQFSPYIESITQQKDIFRAQLELAIHYKMPVILHVRKAIAEIFQIRHLLKNCPAVVFHSYAGSFEEAISLSKTINAYFSFGTPVLWGAKQANLCLSKLPLDRLFLETDAPWQPIRGQNFTSLSMIHTLYEYCAQRRETSVERIEEVIYESFKEIFMH